MSEQSSDLDLPLGAEDEARVIPAWVVEPLAELGLDLGTVYDWDTALVTDISVINGDIHLDLHTEGGWSDLCPFFGDGLPVVGGGAFLVWEREHDEVPVILLQPGPWSMERPILIFYKNEDSMMHPSEELVQSYLSHNQLQIAWLEEQVRQREQDKRMLEGFLRQAQHHRKTNT